MSRSVCLAILFSLSFASFSVAQTMRPDGKIEINGQVLSALITEDDTLYIAELEDISITSKRKFKSREEYLLYNRYRRYANKVYPYAVEAIRVFRELEEVQKDLSKRKRRKNLKRLQKELKEEFEDPLRNLSRTQGRILVHMIERELDTPLHFLIKDLKGGISAMYWTTAGSFFGYHLREGYVLGEDPIMDIVLADFDVAHPK